MALAWEGVINVGYVITPLATNQLVWKCGLGNTKNSSVQRPSFVVIKSIGRLTALDDQEGSNCCLVESNRIDLLSVTHWEEGMEGAKRTVKSIGNCHPLIYAIWRASRKKKMFIHCPFTTRFIGLPWPASRSGGLNKFNCCSQVPLSGLFHNVIAVTTHKKKFLSLPLFLLFKRKNKKKVQFENGTTVIHVSKREKQPIC